MPLIRQRLPLLADSAALTIPPELPDIRYWRAVSLSLLMADDCLPRRYRKWLYAMPLYVGVVAMVGL